MRYDLCLLKDAILEVRKYILAGQEDKAINKIDQIKYNIGGLYSKSGVDFLEPCLSGFDQVYTYNKSFRHLQCVITGTLLILDRAYGDIETLDKMDPNGELDISN